MSDSEPQLRRWRVSGRVQGVNFRAATQAEARRLGIEDGWAVNLPDGDVEVCARGSAEALDALQGWLQHGPRFASVTAVAEQTAPSSVPRGFGTG